MVSAEQGGGEGAVERSLGFMDSRAAREVQLLGYGSWKETEGCEYREGVQWEISQGCTRKWRIEKNSLSTYTK